MAKRRNDNERSDRLIDDEMRYMTDEVDESLLFLEAIFILYPGQPTPTVWKRTY
jgi:hypothetical protein